MTKLQTPKPGNLLLADGQKISGEFFQMTEGDHQGRYSFFTSTNVDKTLSEVKFLENSQLHARVVEGAELCGDGMHKQAGRFHYILTLQALSPNSPGSEWIDS